MTEPTTKGASGDPNPQPPEIRCGCGETFGTITELEEHAQRYHKK